MTVDRPLASFEAQLNFANPLYRGYRAPNQWSVKDPQELINLGSRETVIVRNGRLLDPPPTLETHGFQLVDAPCELNLLDIAVVKEQYFEQCREDIKRVTGCDQVVGGGFEYRNGFGGVKGDRGVKPTPNGSGGAYAQGIHSDMCAVVERYFSRLFDGERHFESLNLWRSTSPGELVQTMPLCVCDMQSVNPADIIFGDGVNTGNVRQYSKVVDQRVCYSPDQRWYYFPDMTADEMLIFRQYDTRQEALNLRTVFHTAVEDPSTPSDAPMRSTIEVRMQAVYGRESDHDARQLRFMSQISDTYRDGTKSDWWSGPIENYVPPQQRL